MVAPTGTLQVFAQVGVKEDVADTIFNVTPANTLLLENAGKAVAINTLHEWLTEALPAVNATNYAVEGDDTTGTTAIQPARIGNYEMTSYREAIVSTLAQRVSTYGRKDERSRQVMLQTKALKRDMESLLIGVNASAVGNATTAREAGALECGITTNILSGAGGSSTAISGATWTAPTDGTARAFTEAQVVSVMQAAFGVSSEAPNILMTGVFNRTVADGFTGGVQRVINDTDKVDGVTGLYATPFGILKLKCNIFQRARTALLLNFNYIKIAYLEPFSVTPIAITGLQKSKDLLAATYTLQLDNELTCGKVADLTTA